VDLDGTLLDRRGLPHARDVRAIQAALGAGIRVSIVTGRLYSGARKFVELLGLKGAVGCADGSHLVHARDHSTLIHHGLLTRDAAVLRSAAVRAGVATFVFAQDAIGHDAAGVPYVEYVATWSRDIRPSESIHGHPFWESEEGVTAVVTLGTRAQIQCLVDDLERDLGPSVCMATFPATRGMVDGAWATVVRASGRTKGTAIQFIAEHERLALAETVCVGDWLNDLPMFEVAGRSFAMGQAPDEVKAKATDLLANTFEEGGGVAAAIDQAFGIRAD
jgi:hydroxymethylpyrimidine pyrophosphatase-like HAD family hydrolase